MEERRKFFRFEIPVDVKYASERDRTEARCRTKNISKEGVAIATDRQLAQDDILKMEFEIPGDNIPVFAHGTVVWVRENKAKMKDGSLMRG